MLHDEEAAEADSRDSLKQSQASSMPVAIDSNTGFATAEKHLSAASAQLSSGLLPQEDSTAQTMPQIHI